VTHAGEHIAEEQLSALIDERLTPDEAAAARAHVADCEACSVRLADLQLVANLLRALPTEELPRDFRLRGSSSLFAIPDPASVVWLRRSYAVARAGAAAMAAAFVFLTVGSLYVDSRSSSVVTVAAPQPQVLSAPVANTASTAVAPTTPVVATRSAGAAAAVAPAAAQVPPPGVAAAARAQPATAPTSPVQAADGQAADAADQTAAATSVQALPTQIPTPQPPPPTAVATLVLAPAPEGQSLGASSGQPAAPWRSAALVAGLLALAAIFIAVFARRRLQAVSRL
jgi:hypothetical protein